MSRSWRADGPVGRALVQSLGRMRPDWRRAVLRSKRLLCEAALVEVWYDPNMYSTVGVTEDPVIENELYGSSGAAWWAEDFCPRHQAQVVQGSEPPIRWRPIENWSDPDRMAKPVGGLWTSRRIDTGATAWSLSAEGRHGQLWMPIADTHDLVVWELRDPSDWGSLCRRFPLTVDGLVAPDWPRVAKEVDVVHFTMAGVVSIQGVRIVVDGRVTIQSGWDVESACWLRPRVQGWVPLTED